MRFHKLIFIVALIPAIALTQAQNKESTKQLQDVIVEESYETEFEEEKQPLELDFDISDVLEIKERVNWDSIDDGENAGTTTLPEMRLGQPSLADIRPAPVKVFQVKLENISRWELNIMANDGSLFRQLTGEGNPPEHIAWDGLSDTGDFLIPGHSYSFSMTAIDKAGNKGTFPGQSFTVPAFYLEQDETVIIGLAGSKITSADGLRLNPDSEKAAQEVAGLIRNFINEGAISVSGQNTHLDQFVQMVATDLIVDPSFFKKVPTQTKKGNYVIFTIN